MHIEAEIQEPKKPERRPSDFTEEIFDVICERMASGEGLRKICEDPEMPSRQTFLRWIEKDTGRQAKYQAAREALMDWYGEEILTIAWDDSKDTVKGRDDKPLCNHEWIQRSRLKVDTLKFLMAKLHPRRYGDKVPEQEAERDLKISWQSNADPVHRIERIILTPVTPAWDDNGDLMGDDPDKLRSRIRQLEEQLNGTSPRSAHARPADEPLAIAYNPTQPPADLSPEAWSAIARVSELIEQIAPGDVMPEHVFGLIESFLRRHFLGPEALVGLK